MNKDYQIDTEIQTMEKLFDLKPGGYQIYTSKAFEFFNKMPDFSLVIYAMWILNQAAFMKMTKKGLTLQIGELITTYEDLESLWSPLKYEPSDVLAYYRDMGFISFSENEAFVLIRVQDYLLYTNPAELKEAIQSEGQ